MAIKRLFLTESKWLPRSVYQKWAGPKAKDSNFMAMSVFFRVLAFGRQERGLILTMLLTGVAIATAQLLEPVLFGRVIDALSGASAFKDLVFGWVILGLVNAALSIYLSTVSDRYAHRQRTRAMELAFDRTLHLGFREHSLQGSGKVIRTIQTGADQVFFIVLSFFRENVIAVSNIVVLIPLSFYLDPMLASVLLLLSCVYAGSNWLVMRQTYKRQGKIEVYHQEITGRLVDVMGQVAIVRSFNRFADEMNYFQDLVKSLLKAQYPVLYWWGLLNVITRLMAMFAMVTIVALGAQWVREGRVTHGEIVTFVGFSTLLIARLEQVSSFINRIVSQMTTAKNLFVLFDQKNVEESLTGVFPRNSIRGEVVFDHVTFVYQQNQSESLQGVFDLHFSVAAGQKVALVGPTGAGKSTCFALLQRLYSPQAGRIFIDGVDIADLKVSEISQTIASVFQDPGLFNRSILENIKIGHPDATMEEIEEAARLAEAHEFIVTRKEGYFFVVGERGLALSGGERQRIAIARAILKKAPILLLDEATSALDYETEARIQVAMERLSRGKTTFVIAHRLSTIVSADLLLVLEHGKIVQQGTYQELAVKQGLFRKLVEAGELKSLLK